MDKLLTITATEAKLRLGEYLEQAHREPVCVQRSGRNSVVIVDYAEYQRLTAIEDSYWGMRALAAEASGFVGPDATNEFLEARLHEE